MHAHLHPTFLFDRFKCLMVYTNLHFSSSIQHSCMETKCSSCPWIVSEFASHQYCFCAVKICGHSVRILGTYGHAGPLDHGAFLTNDRQLRFVDHATKCLADVNSSYVMQTEDLGPVIKPLWLKMHFYGVKVNFEGSELFVISKDRKQISVSCLVCK